MNKLIFVGVIKKIPNCGVSMKNKLFIERFREVYDQVYVVGVKKSRKNVLLLPLQLLLLAIVSLIHPKAIIVVSSNSWESNIIINLLYFLGQAKRVRFWVAGGIFHQLVGVNYPIRPFKKVHTIYVQSDKMVKVMKQKGLNNAVYIPNSKRIDYIPTLVTKNDNDKIHFVFLSRIHPDKGCGLILDSVSNLNKSGFGDKFDVAFYGDIFSEYKEEFLRIVGSIDNVSYNGYLDLTQNKGYDILSKYDVMLFPTYWHGEGFPGIVIDAYISGVPIIASDWNFNTDVVTDKTGVIIPHHSQVKLEEEMYNFINGKYPIDVLKRNCQSAVRKYDNREVLSEKNLVKIGMLNKCCH